MRRRVLDFVDGRVLRFFLKPYFVAGRLPSRPRTIGGARSCVFSIPVGLAFLRELSEFFRLRGLFDSFRKTAVAMERCCARRGHDLPPRHHTLLVAGERGGAFAEALRKRSLCACAVVANRVHLGDSGSRERARSGLGRRAAFAEGRSPPNCAPRVA
jgi:hypothetical protein